MVPAYRLCRPELLDREEARAVLREMTCPAWFGNMPLGYQVLCAQNFVQGPDWQPGRLGMHELFPAEDMARLQEEVRARTLARLEQVKSLLHARRATVNYTDEGAGAHLQQARTRFLQLLNMDYHGTAHEHWGRGAESERLLRFDGTDYPPGGGMLSYTNPPVLLGKMLVTRYDEQLGLDERTRKSLALRALHLAVEAMLGFGLPYSCVRHVLLRLL